MVGERERVPVSRLSLIFVEGRVDLLWIVMAQKLRWGIILPTPDPRGWTTYAVRRSLEQEAVYFWGLAEEDS